MKKVLSVLSKICYLALKFAKLIVKLWDKTKDLEDKSNSVEETESKFDFDKKEERRG